MLVEHIKCFSELWRILSFIGHQCDDLEIFVSEMFFNKHPV